MILFCAILLGRYYMLRKSEYIGPVMKCHGPKHYRFSVRTMETEPHSGLQKVNWNPDIDSIALQIHGGGTDWINCDTERFHGKFPEDHPNQQICIIRNFHNLYRLIHERFEHETEKVFTRWVRNLLIADIQDTKC